MDLRNTTRWSEYAEEWLAGYSDDDQQDLTLSDLAAWIGGECSPILFIGLAQWIANEYGYDWFACERANYRA